MATLRNVCLLALSRSATHETGLARLSSCRCYHRNTASSEKSPPNAPWQLHGQCSSSAGEIMLSAQASLTLQRYQNASKEKSFINKVITPLDSMEPQLFHGEVLSVYAADKNCCVRQQGPMQSLLFICKTLLAVLHFLKKIRDQKSTCQHSALNTYTFLLLKITMLLSQRQLNMP